MRVLITGITGMAGSHLAEYLMDRGDCEVHGTLRWRSNRENIAGIEKGVFFHECELRDPYAVTRLLREVRPHRIYHLASQSNVAASWLSPRETLVNNITSQLNILESLTLLDQIDTRVHIAGSSEEYGMVQENELPVTESNPLRPISPYGVSKVTQDTMAYQYFQNFGLHIVRTRCFNHTGPRRSDSFATSSFARQIVEIEKKRKDPVILVGNLQAKRDFTDIRDVVRAYHLALEHCEPGGVYNIGSGIATSLRQVLDLLLTMSRMAIRVKLDDSRMRPSDVPVLLADASAFKRKTGWKPEISLQQSLFDLLEYWRGKLGRREKAASTALPTVPERFITAGLQQEQCREG
ncbi:MAG: GDP-mannose 4,6-dehydratase [Deltaproteobacteria bacterium HGW-Deltaproteobacteria-15]|jgi:GDP-4-dehydro-6-deoxy-D-mannose reductase|nr:MAG: GDP-mannose 4,6-dehydratase [Deltaproteobacteria bacterium HGW-Deltaproteobacteria-15]